MLRRTFITAVAVAALGAATQAQSQSYPERPVRLVVPYAPGGSADIIARLISDDWGKVLGKPIFVENKAGAGGNIGVDAVAKSKADGYTIGLQTVSLAINPALFPTMPYDTLKDLAPIGMVATSQHVLVTTNALPAKNLKDLLAMIRSEPGKLSYASAGSGSTFHIAAELFKSVGKLDIAHVPYRGGGPALIDTIGGQVDMSFPVLSAARSYIESGKIRGIGVTGAHRSPLMPDVPTLAEAGLPDYRFDTWFMVFAPAATPGPVIDKLNATLAEVLGSPATKDRLGKDGFEVVQSTPREARQRLEQEIPGWAKLIKEQGLAPE